MPGTTAGLSGVFHSLASAELPGQPLPRCQAGAGAPTDPHLSWCVCTGTVYINKHTPSVTPTRPLPRGKAGDTDGCSGCGYDKDRLALRRRSSVPGLLDHQDWEQLADIQHPPTIPHLPFHISVRGYQSRNCATNRGIIPSYSFSIYLCFPWCVISMLQV